MFTFGRNNIVVVVVEQRLLLYRGSFYRGYTVIERHIINKYFIQWG
jgi:hypothetical protein